MRGKRRCLCKSCGLSFTDTPAPGKPLAMKAAAALLHVSGSSKNRTGELLGVPTPTIQAWPERLAKRPARQSPSRKAGRLGSLWPPSLLGTDDRLRRSW